MTSLDRRQLLLSTSAGALAAAIPLPGAATRSVVPILNRRNAYAQTNLAASKGSYGAKFTFEGLVNAWGIAIRPAGAGGHFWVTAGATSYQFVGDVSASPNPALRSLFQDDLGEVYIPGADSFTTNDSIGKVTGTTYIGLPINSSAFRANQQAAMVNGQNVLFDGSARFVFVTDSGTISAWTDRGANGSTVRVNGAAQLMFDGSSLGMAFFGVAAKTDTWDRIWVADFGADPQIRQFNAHWELVPTIGFTSPFATGALRDEFQPERGNKARPGDPVPFNIHVLNRRAFVMYCISQIMRNEAGFITHAGQFFSAEEDSLDRDAEAKASGFPNRGKLVEYNLDGEIVKIYEDLGRLNAPWGVASAPANFGLLSNMLLVGNFGGAGKIAAFNQITGRFVDFMRDPNGSVIGLDGTWALVFGNGASLGDTNALYFASGTEGETAGLFGSFRYIGDR